MKGTLLRPWNRERLRGQNVFPNELSRQTPLPGASPVSDGWKTARPLLQGALGVFEPNPAYQNLMEGWPWPSGRRSFGTLPSQQLFGWVGGFVEL